MNLPIVHCQAEDSSKKWTNEFVLTSMRRVFVRFFEESSPRKKTSRDYLTFSITYCLVWTAEVWTPGPSAPAALVFVYYLPACKKMVELEKYWKIQKTFVLKGGQGLAVQFVDTEKCLMQFGCNLKEIHYLWYIKVHEWLNTTSWLQVNLF